MPSSSMSSTSYLQGEQRRRQRLMIALHHAGVATNGHVFLLVGGMVVADHLSQDPLLVALHALHPRRHLVSLFGYVVTARRGRPAQRRRAGEGGVTEKMLPQKVSRSTPEHQVQATDKPVPLAAHGGNRRDTRRINVTSSFLKRRCLTTTV